MTSPPLRSTRSGKTFSPYDEPQAYEPVVCEASFDFEALLQSSTAMESELFAAYDQGPPASCYSPPADPTPPAMAGPRFSSHLEAPAKKLSDSHKRRKQKRQDRKDKVGQVPRPEVLQRFVKNAVAIEAELDFADSPATAGAYSAKSGSLEGAKVKYTVDGLRSLGFQVVSWDGRTDRPIIDKTGRVVGALVGQPDDEAYRQAADRAFTTILEEGRCATFRPEERKHRRSATAAMNVGVTHGKGTLRPVTLDNHQNTGMAQRLLANEDISRIATFASASFAFWAPKVYAYCKEHLDPLYKKMPSLKRNFRHSIYPCAAFNFGPAVWTYKHRDVGDLPFGWCSIQAGGSFDPKKGGHFIIWELKMVIEFPPGSLILIPSATFTHSNIPIDDGWRVSFTQFASGGLFRYVDYGYQTEKALIKEDPALYAEVCRLRPERWKVGLALLSKFENMKK